MSSKNSFLNSQSVFIIGILFVLLLFLVAVIFIFSQFFRNASIKGVDTDNNSNTKDIFLDKNFDVEKNDSPVIIDYNFKI